LYRGKYYKAKEVNSILCGVASLLDYKTDEQLEDLYEKTAWHFEEKSKNQSSSYDTFKQVGK
jgi:translation initiation factor 2 subunit 1